MSRIPEASGGCLQVLAEGLSQPLASLGQRCSRLGEAVGEGGVDKALRLTTMASIGLWDAEEEKWLKSDRA